MAFDVDRIEPVERVVQVLGLERLGAHDESGNVELEDDEQLDDVGSERRDGTPEHDVAATNGECLRRDNAPAGDDRAGEFDAVSRSDRFVHLQTLVLPPNESRVQQCDVAIEVAVVHGCGPRLERSRRIVGDHATVRRTRVREFVEAPPSIVETIDREDLLAVHSSVSQLVDREHLAGGPVRVGESHPRERSALTDLDGLDQLKRPDDGHPVAVRPERLHEVVRGSGAESEWSVIDRDEPVVQLRADGSVVAGLHRLQQGSGPRQPLTVAACELDPLTVEFVVGVS